MKYSNYQSFEKHLEAAAPKDFADLYFIHCKDAFIKKQATDRLISLVLNKESLSLSLQIFDAEKHSIEKVVQELETYNFLVAKRFVLIQNVDAFDKASLVILERYFVAANRKICLVLTGSAINRASGFYKKLEKQGVLLDVTEEKPWEKEKNSLEWLRAAFAKENKQVAPAIVQQMVRQLGTDQALLYRELLKLICHVGDRKVIQADDVSAICCIVDSGTIWQLGEAVFRCDTVDALRLIKGLLTDGGAFIGVLRQLRAQFQVEFNICSILSDGGGGAEVSQQYPYMKGQILDKHLVLAKNYGMPRCKKGLLAIDETELRAKGSGLEPDFLAEILIIKLTL